MMHGGQSRHDLLLVPRFLHSYLSQLVRCDAFEEVSRIVAGLHEHGGIV